MFDLLTATEREVLAAHLKRASERYERITNYPYEAPAGNWTAHLGAWREVLALRGEVITTPTF